jgi:tRNA modification GTPase
MNAHWWRGTAGHGGALGVYGIRARHQAELAEAMRAMGRPVLPVGGLSLWDVPEVDQMVAARPSADALWLTPHAGSEVARRVSQWLSHTGLQEAPLGDELAWVQRFPEARSAVEAMALAVLAKAASPLAVPILLAQHALWAGGGREMDDQPDQRDVGLRWLITPPLVVVVGRPNAGKSTLLNTLAGRSVSVASDLPGTTLDHVGVHLDLGGLVVRWVDTPGLDLKSQIDDQQRKAQLLARMIMSQSDLLVVVGEATGADPRGVLAEVSEDAVQRTAPRLNQPLVLGTKSDLRATSEVRWADLLVSAQRGDGMDALVRTVRDRLIAPEWLTSERPWRFW